MEAAPEGAAMELPEWAHCAFEKYRPHGVGKNAPNPIRLAWWESCKQRFELRWHDLAADEWRVPQEHDCYAALRRTVIFEPTDYVRLCILETVLGLAWQKSIGHFPHQVASAVRELESLNIQIQNTARDLAALFRQRTKIQFSHGVEELESELNKSDPFELWDALELSMEMPKVSDWAYVAQYEAAKFLNIARTQSRPCPEWSDMLDQVAERSLRRVVPSTAGDVAVIASRTNTTEWSQWARVLLGTLDDWHGTFPEGFLRECLTYNQLANLAEVALDAPDDAYNADQLRRLADRYKTGCKQ